MLKGLCLVVTVAAALTGCGQTTGELRTAVPDRVVTGTRAFKDVAGCLALKLQEQGEGYGGGAKSFDDTANAKVVIIMTNTRENVVYAEVAEIDGKTVVELKDGIRYTWSKQHLDQAESSAKACLTAS
jgi:hypothetical protein